MNEKTSTEKNFIGYEYKEIPVKKDLESIYADGYVNFGWQLEDISSSYKYAEVVMKFKRDRKIRNKMELTRLQRQFDACIAEVRSLENAKMMLPSAVAYGLGLIGTACMAGSVFSYLGGQIVLCILLAIPGFLGWILPYFIFNNLHRKKSFEIEPLIENKYDEIYDVCEKANSLLGD